MLKNHTDLKCDLLYKRDYNFVKSVLLLPEWNDEKFKPLLTPSIWQSNNTNVSMILNMSYWNNPKFEKLLTPNIWQNDVNTVIKKLNLEYWKNPLYFHLLVPSIFNISLKNIKEGISLFEEYKINAFITNRALRRNQKYQGKLIEYMITNNISLLIETKGGKKKLNPILSASTTCLKTKYHININYIENVEKERSKI